MEKFEPNIDETKEIVPIAEDAAEKAEKAADEVKDAAEDAVEKAEETVEAVVDEAEKAADEVKDAAEDAAGKVEETVEAVADEAEKAADEVKDAAEDAAGKAEESVEEKSEEPKMDGIALGCDLCSAVLDAVGRDGFHGGVRPDNIAVTGDGKVTLGGKLEHGVGEFTPQELEYMAPELFWDGVRSPSADVYSAGLVLYAIYNYGRMPFWPEEGEATPNLRAAALQKRMSREEIPAPSGAGKELSAIILRALAFSAEERWHDAEELRSALRDCEEEQQGPANIAMVVAGLMAKGVEPLKVAEPPAGDKKRRNNDDIDSPFVEDVNSSEQPIPKVRVRRRRRRTAQFIVYAVLLAAIVALVFLLKRCSSLREPVEPVPTPEQTAEDNTDPDAVKIINGNQSDTFAEENPEPVVEPTMEPTPTPIPGKVEYRAVRADVSWSEAVARCEAEGGELAMPANYAEFLEITRACEDAGLSCAWLGARRDESGNWVTASGEPATFFAWGDGEPSGQDSDGTAEDYYLLWNLVDNRWSGNDMRENPVAQFPAYRGIIGYVIKTVTYEEAEAPVEAPVETEAETIAETNG